MLIKCHLQGRIMPQTFRDQLSHQGVVFLGGDRTFYQLTKVSECLSSLNSVFSFGRRFITELRESKERYKVLKVGERWTEFLQIIMR